MTATDHLIDVETDCLHDAIRIGDALLAYAEQHEHGLAWTTPVSGYDKAIHLERSVSIASGASGIVSFLLALYQITNDQRYLTAALEGTRWAAHFCENNPTDDYGFYTGYMGVVFTLIRVHQLTRNPAYLQQALAIARPCTDAFVKSPYTTDALSNGRAGALLVLTHLFTVTRQPWLLESIHLFVDTLIEGLLPAKQGLYWKHNGGHIQGLCSLAQGTAGIGYVLLELGHYFQNEAFHYLARQAAIYENSCWDDEHLNWMDFRKEVQSGAEQALHRAHFLHEHLDFFTTPGDATSLAHGTAGIGLARLRAFHLLHQHTDKADVDRAAEKLTTAATARRPASYALYEGKGGHALFLLEAYKAFGVRAYLYQAQRIAAEAMAQVRAQALSRETDYGLFTGVTGMGYVALCVQAPHTLAPSFLPGLERGVPAPDDAEQTQTLLRTVPLARKRMLVPAFGRTLGLLHAVCPDRLNGYFESIAADNLEWEKEAFIHFVEDQINGLPDSPKARLVDVFNLEQKRVQRTETLESGALLYIKEVIQQEEVERLLNMDDEDLLEQVFSMDERTELVHTRWDWCTAWNYETGSSTWNYVGVSKVDLTKNLDQAPDDYVVLLRLNSSRVGIQEILLHDLSVLVLDTFKARKTGNRAVAALISRFDVTSGEERQKIEKLIMDQIKEFISTGILRAHPPRPSLSTSSRNQQQRLSLRR